MKKYKILSVLVLGALLIFSGCRRQDGMPHGTTGPASLPAETREDPAVAPTHPVTEPTQETRTFPTEQDPGVPGESTGAVTEDEDVLPRGRHFPGKR